MAPIRLLRSWYAVVKSTAHLPPGSELSCACTLRRGFATEHPAIAHLLSSGRSTIADRRPVQGGQQLSLRGTSRRSTGAPDQGGREARGAAWGHRYRKVGHHGLVDRTPAAADVGAGAEQDTRRADGQRAAQLLPGERGRVLRQLLRLLPAGSVRPADRHLHREGLLDQRGRRARLRHSPRRTCSAAGTASWCPRCRASTAWALPVVPGPLHPPQVGGEIDRDVFLRALVDVQYTRNDVAFARAPSGCAGTPSK